MAANQRCPQAGRHGDHRTYNIDHLKHQKFNPKWLLKSNELVEAFKDMKIIRYQAYEDDDQAYSSIIIQKQNNQPGE